MAPSPKKPTKLSFRSRLERVAPGANYFSFSVPATITRALGTVGPVPVSVRINGAPPFLVSLHPVGGGRHKLRVKASARSAAGVGEGDRAQVEITVVERDEKPELPKDLATALRAEGARKDFDDIPVGQRTFMLRKLDEAARPETRARRIREMVEAAHARREGKADRATR